MAIESPAFTLEKSDGPFEIRSYGMTIIAETRVQGDFESAGSQGFRRLADYIFGNNRSRTRIDMTAPVRQEEMSEKIEMTAPVAQRAEGNTYIIAFTMPTAYTMETLPIPIDPAVSVRQEFARRTAVITYSGFWSQSRYEEKLAELKAWMKLQGLQEAGEPVFARYNPPWMPWFLRRNEIMWEIRDTANKP